MAPDPHSLGLFPGDHPAQDKVPPLFERDGMAKKDTILLRDNDVVNVFVKFTDHPGPYVFHCHNLEHEDMAMMARFDTVRR